MATQVESLPRELAALLGETIAGRYRLDEILGSGGMGVVFGGVQVKLKRPIAVKVLDPEVADSDRGARRFKREAESVARLDHINCLAVYDYGTTPRGLHFMVMPRLSGRPLSEMIAEENLSARRALGFVEQALAGLVHAHGQGLVHRDLKPSNMFVVRADDSDDEIVKIVDFGIAKIVDEDPDSSFQTRTGLLFGTPAYMSPEQAVGEPIDARSDLYTLGIVLYCLLCGDVPHRGMSVMDQLRKRATLEVPQLPAPCPPEISELISFLCAREPKDRCPDAATARDRVREILAQLPVSDPAWDEPLPRSEIAAVDGETRADESLKVSTLSTARSGAVSVETPIGVVMEAPIGDTAPLTDTLEEPVDGPLAGSPTDETEDHGDEQRATLATPESGRAQRRITIAAVAVVGGLGLWAWLGMDRGTPVASDTEVADVVPSAPPEDASAVGQADQEPPEQTEATLPSPEPSDEPDLIEKLGRVNVESEAAALTFAERHALLAELRANPKTSALIDEGSQSLLDLEQLRDSPTPCETYVSAVGALEGSKAPQVRKALRRAELPDGESEACGEARKLHAKLHPRDRSTKHEASQADVAAEDSGPRPGEITPKLGPLK